MVNSVATATGVKFLSARPVWPAAREKEMNLFVGFRALFDAGKADRTVLRLTASSVYRAFLNGVFLGYGPARGPEGWFRVDEWDLTGQLKPGKNILALEVAGYNVNSYYLLDQPAFLQAEIVADGRTLAATRGRGNSFDCHILNERVQKVQRYSFQRPFSEVYRLRRDSGRWRADASMKLQCARCAEMPPKRLLRRGVSYPTFERLSPVWHVACGRLQTGLQPEKWIKPRYLTQIGPTLGGFVEAELDCAPFLELQTVANASSEKLDRPFNTDAVRLSRDAYHLLDFGVNRTGFLGATLRCRKPTRLFFTFDEILTDGDVDFTRYDCVNIVTFELPAGEFRVESFEPYTLRYLKLIALGGDCELRDLYMREYVAPDVWQAQFAAADERLNRIFEAGRETFRQNAVDVLTDCPGRERAGWLCDSFFTSRAAADLMGHAGMERNFYENFLLPESFPHLPDGMLPACYPANHRDGCFIPNWALWFVVELEEYLARSGDRTMVDALQPKIRRLFDYFRRFRNSDGLLEKLESWVFVEWSNAQSFVQDVNYPSNMLYAAALSAAGRMYHDRKLLRQAQQVRRVVLTQSFDGRFFVDNAVRQDGKLQVTTNRTEVCQYFAFFFGLATPEDQPDLWRTLCEQFGPRRDLEKTFPEVHPANAFIGVMLRLELLSRYDRCRQMLDESMDYWLYMAEATGTLWEHLRATASCNHGFTSHVCHTLYRDVLGLREVDTRRKRLALRFPDLPLEWCRGRIPTPDGPVVLSWRKENGTLAYRVEMPAGYSVAVDNPAGLSLKRRA
jgi:alpha-L-rhamnosidase